MKQRVETLVYQAFSIYVGLNGSPSTTNSSSSGSLPQSSMLGGSFQHLSTPKSNRGQLSSTGTRSTTQSQAYSMDMAGSPAVVRSLSQGHPTTIGHSFMGIPRMTTQHFRATNMQSAVPNEQPTHAGFHPAMTSNLGDFDEDLFADTGMGAGDGRWEPMDFNEAPPSFYDGNPGPGLSSASYVDIRSPLGQTLLDTTEDTTRNLADPSRFRPLSNSQKPPL